MHQAVKQLQQISQRTGLGMDELSLRWIVYHSILHNEDCVIAGASKLHHITKNAEQIQHGPLGPAVVKELDDLWEGVKADGENIVNSVSSRM